MSIEEENRSRRKKEMEGVIKSTKAISLEETQGSKQIGTVPA
jgi:hypothetical protein